MKKLGCGPLAILILIIAILLLYGANEVAGLYFGNCGKDDDMMDCILAETDEPPEEGEVVATGSYEYKGYTVNFSMNIPLAGGAVSGFVSDTCEGKITGTYSGQNNGAISGNITAACSPFFVNIPATATFAGSVNKGSKKVPFTFNGSGAGKTHQGSTTLSY